MHDTNEDDFRNSAERLTDFSIARLAAAGRRLPIALNVVGISPLTVPEILRDFACLAIALGAMDPHQKILTPRP